MKRKSISNLCRRLSAGALAFVMAAGSVPAMSVQAETSIEVDGTTDAYEDMAADGTVEMPTKDSVKFATFNIAAMQQPSEEKMTAILNQLEDRDIDFAGLQEIDKNTGRNSYDMLEFFRGETYTDIFFQKTIDFDGGEYGFGTISKSEIKEKTGGQLITLSGEQRCWQRSLVEVDGEQIAFYNTHFSYSPRAAVEAQVQELKAMMDADTAEYIVAVGDFNVDIDKEILYPFLEDYNLANGKDGVWYDTFNSESGLLNNYAIDNIITSRNIEVKSVNHEDNTLSDHDMLWVECALLDEEVASSQYLDILVKEARAIDASLYYADTYAPVAAALAVVDAYTELPAQEVINADAKALAAALDGLVAIPTEDTNLAYGKVVPATTYNITDGTVGYYWTGPTYPASFEIDLGEVTAVEKMVAYPYNDGSRYYHYTIEVSEDGETYTQVAEKSDNTPETAEGTTYEFEEAVNARYVKVTMTYNSSNMAVHMREFEIYAKDAETGELVNVAKGLPALGTGVTVITDGSTNNYWDGGEYPGYFIIDLGYNYPVNKFVAFPYNTGTRYYNYYIEVSEDGVNYTKVAEKMDTTPEVAAGTTFELEEPVNARFVKVTMTYNNDNRSVHMKEFQVYPYIAPETDATPTPEPTPVPAELTNVAVFGTPYADSEYAGLGPIVNINDGNQNSIWIAGTSGCPVSAGVELDNVYDVQKVKVVFEYRQTTDQILKFYAEYKDQETGEYVQFWEGQNYDAELNVFYDEIELDAPITTDDIRITITERINTAAWPAFMELEVYAVDDKEHEVPVVLENVALNKPVEVSAGTQASVITDGATGAFWDGGAAPADFIIDLQTGHFISSFKALTYYGDGRYYHYDISVSLDGYNYTKVASKENNNVATSSGEVYELEEPVNARYVRVEMNYNSANPSVHMKEFEVYGVADPDYVEPEKPTSDTKDPENVAYGKPVHSHLSAAKTVNVTDGIDGTYWNGQFYPAYLDLDMEEEYDISEVVLNFPTREGRYYYYTVYGSNDGRDFQRIYQKRDKEVTTDAGDVIPVDATYRIIRVYIEYCSDAGSARLSEIRVHGTPTGANTGDLRTGSIDEILGIEPYSATKYAAEITEAETFENIYGIIDRTIGSEYRDWFEFAIAPNTANENDYYELSMTADGKVLITGNEGLSITSGLNYYYKNYCNVNISEQANQTVMPEEIVAIDGVVRRESPYAIRYAMNYCTMDYTFAFFGPEDFQKENDWLALNGVNVVLDLAGQEAVWIKFLMNFGYSFDEAKDWLAGPSYYAWQFMDNLEIFGGPVSDGWVTDRLEMARENQRWKNSLGMQTVLQGYAGMIPTNFAEYQDVDILKQGGWCGLDRPDMIRTDGELYDQYAELFYAAQEWALGDTTDYYAADPFHEGGIRPSDLSDDTIAAEVLDSLLKYDEDAVWMVQAWWSNPTNALLNGMGEYRQDHVIILDLTGLEAPKWNSTSYGSTKLDADEFNGTDWVWCMLENYGGNPSMDGQLEKIAADIPAAYAEAEHMKGIGIISEATYDNPAIYELVFDMAWETEALDVDTWLDDYVVRRYGAESESAREAWAIIKDTVYDRSGNTSYTLARLPENVGSQGLPYVATDLEDAFKLLIEDYDVLSASEAYLYDLTEIMRQLVNNYAVLQYNKVLSAYNSGDLEAFQAEKELFLNAFDVCDLVQGTQVDQLVGEWIGKAEDWAAKYDDFSYDSLTMNAKALITTWAGAASASALPDYAYRNYQGMMTDLYKARWSTYLDKMEAYLADGTAVDKLTQSDYFHFYWEWVMNTPDYTREAKNTPDYMAAVIERVLDECSAYEEVPENDGNIALDKPVTTTSERPDSPGAPGGGYAAHIVDGVESTYWDGVNWNLAPEAVIDLEAVYTIDKINVLTYVTGSRYYLYDIYTSIDGETWTQIVSKDTTVPDTAAGDNYLFEDVTARYVKIIGRKNSANEGFHICEVRVYGELVPEKEKLEIITQPVDVTVEKGENATVFVEATGEGLTYTWYYKKAGGHKYYVSGVGEGDTYSIPMYAYRDGYQVYCVITDESGDSIKTNEVTLSMKKPAIVITKQPVDASAAMGEAVTVSVEAEGEGLTYTWYYKRADGGKFYQSGLAVENTYTTTMYSYRNGYQVYCVITNAAGETVQTNTVTLTMAE